MSNTVIQIRSSGVTGNVPSVLRPGELAINYVDGTLFYGNTSNNVLEFKSGAIPAGLSGELQFNNLGDLGASANVRYSTVDSKLYVNNLVANTITNSTLSQSYAHANAAYDKANTSGGISITDDTTSNVTYYPILASTNSGAISVANTSSSKMSFNPSTGTLSVVDLNTTSDKNYKDNIVPINSAIDIINKMNGVSFTWKDSGNKSYGVIAQELLEVLPELVKQEEKGLTVSYLPLIAILIEAVKDQQKQIDELK